MWNNRDHLNGLYFAPVFVFLSFTPCQTTSTTQDFHINLHSDQKARIRAPDMADQSLVPLKSEVKKETTRAKILR